MRSGCRSQGHRGDGSSQDDAGVDVTLSDGGRCGRSISSAAMAGGASSARRRGSTSPARTHHQQPDRRSRAGRDCRRNGAFAAMHGHPLDRPGGIRNPRWAVGLFGGSGPVRVLVTEREVGKTGEPTLAEVKGGADRRLRHRLRHPQPDLDHPLYRRGAAGRELSSGSGAGRRRRGAYPSARWRHGVADRGAGRGEPGWKLAQVITETSPESLLDSYHAERHPVGVRVLRYTMAAVALRREDDRTKRCARRWRSCSAWTSRAGVWPAMTGLGIHYDLGEGHPLLGPPHARSRPGHGQRARADFRTAARCAAGAAQPRRAGRLRHHSMGGSRSVDRRQYAGSWELPGLGVVTAPTAVLIRPDGYVAWVGDLAQLGLADALTTWFGPPTAA